MPVDIPADGPTDYEIAYTRRNIKTTEARSWQWQPKVKPIEAPTKLELDTQLANFSARLAAATARFKSRAA